MWTLRSSIFIVLCSSIVVTVLSDSNSPYLSPTTLLNYQKMIQNFKIFMYKPNEPQFKFATPIESLFLSSLQNSSYLTQNPEEAHLFFLPFSSDLPTRSIARIISRARTHLPYWNRTLGADHFFLSWAGVAPNSDRNIVELKKNAIQISSFPARRDRFIPHKDVTLPPLTRSHAQGNETVCVVEYGNDVSLIGEAMRQGCVPVVVTEGPVNDVPFMDVLRWGEMAVFVRSKEGVNARVLGDDTWNERHLRMKRLGAVACKHLVWNQPPLPFDAFSTVMYQLWLRRHTIRYASVE